MAEEVRIYDILADQLRPVTQADVSSLGCVNAAFGASRSATIALAEVTLRIAQGKTRAFDIAKAILDAEKASEAWWARRDKAS